MFKKTRKLFFMAAFVMSLSYISFCSIFTVNEEENVFPCNDKPPVQTETDLMNTVLLPNIPIKNLIIFLSS